MGHEPDGLTPFRALHIRNYGLYFIRVLAAILAQSFRGKMRYTAYPQ